jgi:hypothetical protein
VKIKFVYYQLLFWVKVGSILYMKQLISTILILVLSTSYAKAQYKRISIEYKTIETSAQGEQMIYYSVLMMEEPVHICKKILRPIRAICCKCGLIKRKTVVCT